MSISSSSDHFNSMSFEDKKRFLSQLLTIYGRKPAKEALLDSTLQIFKLHLADSNKKSKIMDEIISLAEARNIEIEWHDRKQLSRISKNSKQDQGVALDIFLNNSLSIQAYCASPPKKSTIIALHKVTNPQNLGMIIRSVCAAPHCILLLPTEGCARIDSLVIKASSGTIFRAPLLRCANLLEGLKELRTRFESLGEPLGISGLDGNAKRSISDFTASQHQVYVLGNETSGLSAEVQALCSDQISIPMSNKVESLNVAITASLLAFKSIL